MAVLVQAIAFVTLVLASQQSQQPTIVAVGPVQFASVVQPEFIRLHSLLASMLVQTIIDSLPAVILLIALLAILMLVLAGPRWVQRSMQ